MVEWVNPRLIKMVVMEVVVKMMMIDDDDALPNSYIFLKEAEVTGWTKVYDWYYSIYSRGEEKDKIYVISGSVLSQ